MMRRRHIHNGVTAFLLGVASTMTVACDGKGEAGEDDTISVLSADTQRSTQAEVLWKRYAALEGDLMGALELSADELCTELGQANCVRDVHRVALGGNDPFRTGLMVANEEPLATTPAVVDRVVLSGCRRRMRLDQEAGLKQAVVFQGLDLEAITPEPSDSRVRDTVVGLYRRLLAREPVDVELELISQLAVNDNGEAIQAADFATLACYVIGTTTEFLFF